MGQNANFMGTWGRGLLSSFIGGGSTAAGAVMTASFLDSSKFNLSTGLKESLMLLFGTFFLSGLSNVFHYLQRSPIPDVPGKLGLVPDSQLVADAPERKAA